MRHRITPRRKHLHTYGMFTPDGYRLVKATNANQAVRKLGYFKSEVRQIRRKDF